uniref:PKD/REJ-like domain-containing protein n=1 Tax=Toxoplasma gondii (strain ATCC 50861 / VEG) TaxID=432359 RepID=A0A0F7VE51_TOXGV|nr:TPA: hypothetical protein BN1205_007140 [Toxoplasma gondii VEG]
MKHGNVVPEMRPTCPNCATPLKRVVNGYSGMVIDVPGEAIFEAAMAAKLERAASVEYKPFVPYFSVADGTVWTVKNDARRFSFSIGVYACAPHEKTVKWSVRSENDQRPATELLEIEENRTDMQFTVSVAPVSLLPGERYFITLEVSYPDSPTYKGSTTVQIDVEKPRSPIAHLQMPDSVDACDAFQIDASASIANAPDSRLAASWKCLSGCNAAINTLLQRQENMLRFTVGSDVVFALAKTHRGGNTGGSTFRLQIQLTLANSYKMTSTVTSITRIAAHLQPPVITSLTPTAASISHTAPYTMDVNLKFCAVAESVENEGLDIRWTVKSKEDSRDLNQILQMSNNALRGTFPAYSLKPAADYTVNVAVTYLDDTRVKTYASFEIHVLPASGFPPVIHLQYPTVVRKCQTIHLDATTTTSSASEPGLTVRWGCDASDCPQKIKELAEAEKTLALAIPDDIVYAVVEQLLGSPASAESLTFTIVLEVQDRDMRTASASATIMLTKDLAPPTVSPTTDTSFELAPSQTATMGIAVAQCPHLPAATGPAAQVEWSVSPDGQPFKLDALVELDRDTPPLSATTKENSLVRGLAYTFEARAFYQGAKHLSNSVAFLVMVDQAGTVPPSVSLTGPEDIVLTACEGLSVHSTASSGTTDDPTLHIYWICLDAECPAEYIKFLESQSDHTELFIPPDMVYKLAKANRQPAATTFTHRLGVVVLNSDRRQATDHVQIEIATYPATPTLQPAGPLNFNINAAEAVTMAVSASYCTHADDATFMWEIKSDFEKRPSDELLTESLDGHRATVAGGKLIAGVTYTVVVSLTYGDLPSTASLLFEIIVAPPEQPAAQPNAIVTGPSGIQGACDPFKLIGTQSQAQTNDAVLLASWNCLGQCPSTFVKAARTAKELTLTMDAATVYQAVKEFKERNPLVNTFDVEFELTVTDSQQNMARCNIMDAACVAATTRVTLQSSLTPPILRATSQQTLEIDSNEGVTLSAAVDYCEHVKTGTSSGLAVEWRSISADPRPFEDLFSVSDNQLTAAAEPGSLHAGTNYTIKLQVAYAGERQHTTIEYTIRVLEATVFLSFNLDTLHEAPITPVSV